VSWHFVVVGPDLTIMGPEQLVSPWVVLAPSGQGLDRSAQPVWRTAPERYRARNLARRHDYKEPHHGADGIATVPLSHGPDTTCEECSEQRATSTACSPKRTDMG
jgi:hypothetical protein